MESKSNNLIIGSTSQLSYYFPKNFKRVSSRDNFEELSKKNWDKVYICFGENRTYLSNTSDELIIKSFYDINFLKTVQTVQTFQNTTKQIFVFSTSELWNQYSGPICLNTPFNFKTNHYTISKYLMTTVLNDKKNYPNVNIVYPFNFNGIHRNGNFLFGKIFDSILFNKKIELGDTYFYRDMLHPSTIVSECLNKSVGEDFIVGSGRLIYVNDLIRDLYQSFKMCYNTMVQECIKSQGIYKQNLFYSASVPPTNNKKTLFEMLYQELKDKKNEN